MELTSKEELEFLEKFELKNCIVLPMNLPFQIYSHYQSYDILLQNVPLIENRNRMFIFTMKDRNVENQEVMPYPNAMFIKADYNDKHTKFDYVISRLTCYIAIDDDEIDELEEIIQQDNFIHTLAQKSLEIFFYKYNCDNIYKDFQLPNISAIAPLSIHLSRNDARKNGTEKWFGLRKLAPSANYNRLSFDFVFKADQHQNWVYFFSKALYNFKFYNFYDTIINCAVSFESYFHNLVRVKKLDKSYLYKIDGGFRTAKNIVNKLYGDKHLVVNNLNKTLLDGIRDTILENRNEIIHGATVEIYDLHEKAKDSIKALFDFYASQKILDIQNKEIENALV